MNGSGESMDAKGPEYTLGDRFIVYAKGHHGYPYPDIGYGEHAYENWCHHCGIHGAQHADFRVRGIGAPHSAFVQLNWAFDTWFVRNDIAIELLTSGLTGFSFRTIIDAKSGQVVDSHRQLIIDTIVESIDTAALPTVTCRKDNEESQFRLPGMTIAEERGSPYCGQLKHHPPTVVGLSGDLTTTRDVFQSTEWFGSGGSAFRMTIASRRFVDFIRTKRWRGLECKVAVVGGKSSRLSG
jgi:hypothetical protein